MGQVTDRIMVSRWLADCEAAWRAAGTDSLAEIVSDDAAYLHSPCEEPVAGLDAIRRMWERDRDGPDEVFTLATSILAVDAAGSRSGLTGPDAPTPPATATKHPSMPRTGVFDVLDYEMVIALDSHWHTTVEFVVAAHQVRAGLFTSDELPRGMQRVP